MLLWPLFVTSYLIDGFLVDNELFGLTSARHAGFVEGLGVYDQVVTYDDLSALPAGHAVFVDIAGDATVRSAVHGAYGDRLAHSMAVGATHRDQPRSAADRVDVLPGPAPAFFFAPIQIAKRTKEWGLGGLDERIGTAWRDFVVFCDGWLRFRHGHGSDAVAQVYAELLEGGIDPAVGHIRSLWPEAEPDR